MSETSDGVAPARLASVPTWPRAVDRFRSLPRPLRYPSIIGLIVVFYYLATASGSQVSVLGSGLLIGLGGIGVGMLLRTLRLASLAQGAFVALGSYSVVIAENYKWGFLPGIVLAVAIGIVTGIFMGFGSFRLRTHYFILLTAAVQTVGTACILGLSSLTGGEEGMSANPVITIGAVTIGSLRSLAIFILAVCVIVALIAESVYHGRWGRRMLAAGNSTALGQASGLSPLAANIVANVFATLCGVLAGILYAPFIGYLGPDDFSITLSLSCFFAGILCIRTSFFMTLLGGVALSEFTLGISSSGGATSGLFYGLIIVVLGLALGLQSKLRSSGRSLSLSGVAARYLRARPGVGKAVNE